MKKTAILLILVMIISLFPCVSVSAVGEYYLKGLYEGETVVVQHEPTKTVYLVDAANAGTTKTTATNVSKVVFTFNDNDPEAVFGATFSYTMEFDSIGIQTLRYDVYKTGNSTNAPDECATITFNVVGGKKCVESTNGVIDFENIADSDLAKTIVANDGANISNRLSLSVEEWRGSKALMVDGDKQNKTAYLQFRGAPSTTGYKIHYYDFDMTMSTAYERKLYVTADGYTGKTNAHVLFTNKKTDTGIGTTTSINSTATAHIELILDYNGVTPVATIYKNGVPWQTISLTNLANGTQDPVVTLQFQTHSGAHPVYIDNFSYAGYDVYTPTFTGASIPGGDNKPVFDLLPEIRFAGTEYFEDQDVAEFIAISERENGSTGDFTVSDLSYMAYIDGTDVVVVFEDELAIGTTYKIDLIGVKWDKYLDYDDYSFTFRTLNEGENILPEIVLTSPHADKRVYPGEGDIVTLNATAIDFLGGIIDYVDFYADGVLIGRATTPIEDDLFTYEWKLDGSIDQAEPVAITAVACDNEGGTATSESVYVTIWNKQFPTVTIETPEEDTVYCSNFCGVDLDARPIICIVPEDCDGTIQTVTVYVDGILDGSVEDPDSIISYELRNELTPGEHTIIVEAIDNHYQSALDIVRVVKVESKGRSGFIINEDYTADNAEDLISNWIITDNAALTKRSLKGYENIKGMILSRDPEISTELNAGSGKRYIFGNFDKKSFTVDMKVAFSEVPVNDDWVNGRHENYRTIYLFGLGLLFYNDGSVVLNGHGTIGTYQPGEIYNLSAVVDADSNRTYILINDNCVGYDYASYAHNPSISIYSLDEAEIAVLSMSVSYIGDAVDPAVTFIDDTTFKVDFPEGADKSTLKDNVKLINAETGKQMSLIYADGIFTVDESLEPATEYIVRVLPDARDINGNGYSGVYEYSFVTADASSADVPTLFYNSLNTSEKISLVANAVDTTKIEGTIIAALYDENDVIVELNAYDAASTVDVEFAETDGKYVKLFWVDLTTARPNSNLVKVNL